MRVTINLSGRGNEFTIGSIQPETWDYIQENFDGDEDAYLDALDEGDVPEEHMLASDRSSLDECDDLWHNNGCWYDQWEITIEDEDGNELYHIKSNDAEKLGVQVEREIESVGNDDRYIAVYSNEAKGCFLSGEFEIEDDFDPKKLKLKSVCVCYDNDDETNAIITAIEYDGEEIECEEDTTGVGTELRFIDQGESEDDDED